MMTGSVLVIGLEDVLLDIGSSLGIWFARRGHSFSVNNILMQDFRRMVCDGIFTGKGSTDRYIGVPISEIDEGYSAVEVIERANFYDNVISKLRFMIKEYDMRLIIISHSISEDILFAKSKKLAKALQGCKYEMIPIIGGDKVTINQYVSYAISDDIYDICDFTEATSYLLSKTYNQEKYNKQYAKAYSNTNRVCTTYQALSCIEKREVMLNGYKVK